ncbi:MAG: chromate resistance protein ChrB domain-containing protein [candidate division WOR-3 bacterium]
MKWITRSHVHVDRVACPWLISRFVDSEAEFMFVAPEIVKNVANEVGGIPFDVDGVELGHRNGRCSFVSIIEKYKLKDPVLHKLAEIVDAADTGKPEKDQYAPGLEAIACGFSLMFPDDYENIKNQFLVYDALYAFLKLKLAKEVKI